GTPGELTADAYRPALLTMVGVLAVGFFANLMVRPVADRFHEEGAEPAGIDEGGGEPESSGDGGVATGTRTDETTRTSTSPALLVIGWAVVGIPLAYGVWQTLVKTVSLFG
nr:MFS transporter [Nocardioidaceae bacterium]